ncbi:MAG: hypothetical protein J7K37_03770 [Candidatus Omnitrophica bacterium]|nr:hypothetical protein [Candidatus Omnitrophota bacterium]
MGNSSLIRNNSQVVIEFILMFVALAMLILGTTRIWVFFNADFVNRQAPYEQTRKVAANPEGSPGQWLPEGYSAMYLTEDWVFKGIPEVEVERER